MGNISLERSGKDGGPFPGIWQTKTCCIYKGHLLRIATLLENAYKKDRILLAYIPLLKIDDTASMKIPP